MISKLINIIYSIGSWCFSMLHIIIILVVILLTCCQCRSYSGCSLTEKDYYEAIKDSSEKYHGVVDSLVRVIHDKEISYQSTEMHDSIYKHDSTSVSVEKRGDTVFVTSQFWHREYHRLYDKQSDVSLQQRDTSSRHVTVSNDSVYHALLDSIDRSTSIEKYVVRKKKSSIWWYAAMGIICLLILVTGFRILDRLRQWFQ